jgi:hypothetical protein
MDALLRGLDRVLAAAEQGGQAANVYGFRAASALCDPEPLEAVYFDAPGSYDLSKVSEIKRTDTIPVCRGVRAVQMPDGFRLDQSRLSVVSTTLATLSELVFPSSHFQHHWVDVSGQECNQLRVKSTRGEPVCILRVGYVTKSPSIAYVCSFKLQGELEQQFNAIRCMAYNLCLSFISRGHAEKTEVLDRTRSLSRYLLAEWGRDQCMYSLDHEDVRLLNCLRGVYSVGGGNFNAILDGGSSLPRFLASKIKTLVTQMETVVAAFAQRFITTWEDPTITLQISPGECYSLTYNLSVDKPFRSGMRTWVLYDVKSGTEVETFSSIERMVGYVCARVKRLELCCLFQDTCKMKLHRAPNCTDTDGRDELVIERSDEVQIEGPAVEDGSG